MKRKCIQYASLLALPMVAIAQPIKLAPDLPIDSALSDAIRDSSYSVEVEQVKYTNAVRRHYLETEFEEKTSARRAALAASPSDESLTGNEYGLRAIVFTSIPKPELPKTEVATDRLCEKRAKKDTTLASLASDYSDLRALLRQETEEFYFSLAEAQDEKFQENILERVRKMPHYETVTITDYVQVSAVAPESFDQLLETLCQFR